MHFLGLADPVSSLSHGLAALGCALLAPSLIRRGRGVPGQAWSLVVFALTAVLLLAASGAFHAINHGTPTSRVLQRLDHAAIFALIAGTFTPIHSILFTGFLRWGMLAIIWTLAVTGIALKLVYFDVVPEWLGVAMYLAMGWLGAVSMIAIWRLRGPRCGLIVWGGVAYTLGAVIELVGWPAKGSGPVTSHELFHIFVLAGLSCHWSYIARIAGSQPIVRMSLGGPTTGLHPVVNVNPDAVEQFVASPAAATPPAGSSAPQSR
jgi:channel protein (hemolysin III family)